MQALWDVLGTFLEEKQINPQLKERIKQYRKFIEETVKKSGVLSKSFYIAVSFSALELGIKSGGVKGVMMFLPKNKNQEGKQKVTPIFLTKPEQKLYNIIINLQLPYRIIAQYKQPIPGQNNPYLLDFAIPDLGLNLEADGDFWHSDPESIQRDKQRDYRLASMGWRIIRLREDALNNKADVVETIIKNNIQEIINEKTRRKANIDNNELIMKISSNEMKDDIVIIKNTLGYDQISSEED